MALADGKCAVGRDVPYAGNSRPWLQQVASGCNEHHAAEPVTVCFVHVGSSRVIAYIDNLACPSSAPGGCDQHLSDQILHAMKCLRTLMLQVYACTLEMLCSNFLNTDMLPGTTGISEHKDTNIAGMQSPAKAPAQPHIQDPRHLLPVQC
jgi:hypothetical protein